MELRGPTFKGTYVASGNMNTDALQFRFVQQVAGVNEDVFIANTSGSVVTGVNVGKVLDNQHVEVAVLGYSKIRVASSLGAGIPVMTDGAGFAVEATSGQFIPGYLHTGATSGTPAEILLAPWRAIGSDPTP